MSGEKINTSAESRKSTSQMPEVIHAFSATQDNKAGGWVTNDPSKTSYTRTDLLDRAREALEKIRNLSQTTGFTFESQTFAATDIAIKALAAIKEGQP